MARLVCAAAGFGDRDGRRDVGGFALTGVLASVLNPLAAAEIGIFALSTFDTDWILVRAESVDAAAAALSAQFRVYGVEPIGG